MEGRHRDQFGAPGRIGRERNNARRRLITQMSSSYGFNLEYISSAAT